MASALLVVVVVGCGSEEPRGVKDDGRQDKVVDISGTEAVGENLGGSVASLVECRDWNGANDEQRLATIADVRSQVSREDAGIDAPALTDGEAEQLFDSACAPAWAQGLRLYKLYARAVGFAPLGRALTE